MKNIILFVLALTITTNVFCQIYDPVKWTTSTEKISETEYELVATATIEGQWHLYSQNVPENGPIPTTFTFKSDKNYLKKGNTKEGEGHMVDDKVFNMKIKYFSKKADFKQRIKLKTKTNFEVNASVEFMVCDDERCLPPTEVDLVFNIE